MNRFLHYLSLMLPFFFRMVIFMFTPPAPPPRSTVRRCLVFSCPSVMFFPPLSVFYESGSHLFAAVCHTLLLETLKSKPVRLRSGRNFPPGAVVSVSWSLLLLSFCSFLRILCFLWRVFPPELRLVCSLWSRMWTSWVNIWFNLFVCFVELICF